MAFRFSPKHVETIALKDINSRKAFVTAFKTAQKLNWGTTISNDKTITAYTNISAVSWTEKVVLSISENQINITSTCNGAQFIDWGKNKKNIESFVQLFDTLKDAYSDEEVLILYNDLLNKSIVTSKESTDTESLQGPAVTPFESIDEAPLQRDTEPEITSIFIPSKNFFVTPILVYINVLVFVLMVIAGVHFMSPSGEDLISWGANFKPLTLDGELWRLLTNSFLHIGVIHIAFNMYALLFIGMLLEPLLGKMRFISAYFATGLLASLASLYWLDYTISAGASGAIFGMYGVFLAMLTTNLINKAERKALLSSIIVFVGYSLFSGFTGEGVDNAAHIGGLASGIIIGFAFYPSLSKPDNEKLKTSSVILVAVASIFISLIAIRPMTGDSVRYRDIVRYEEGLTKFIQLEEKALAVYNLPQNTIVSVYMLEAEKGIEKWEESKTILNELYALKLPKEDLHKCKKLIRYCNLRIESYNLIYNSLLYDSDK